MSDTLKIKPGDSINKIAKKIYDTNKKIIGDDPNLIYPDTSLVIHKDGTNTATIKEVPTYIIEKEQSPDYSMQLWAFVVVVLVLGIIWALRKPKESSQQLIIREKEGVTKVGDFVKYVDRSKTNKKTPELKKSNKINLDNVKVGDSNL
jgi:hypothetical protein